MQVILNTDWKNLLKDEFEKPYFKALSEFITEQYKQHTCYPKTEEIFNAFNYCSLDSIKVVIIGQDPYHGPNQANGLCFSVHDGIPHPPSLKNIFKEITASTNTPYPESGNLEHWAKQGVLLLNATLTVKTQEAGSHQKKGWETFTDTVIKKISDKKTGVIFLLWGGYAKKKTKLIDTTKHYILKSGHPSPLSANRGYWFGNNHFNETNLILKNNQLNTIEW
ncbi:uracil-DNA glycosylase [Cellulophaga baltica]|uniref:uracil-DNA glycosylase n=1 Tax=Cellulophaga TaxID=104264 RepID=UPI001C065D86|nr:MULTISPECIES: uracil-DNA glycosylase [Cellulophaga]MBU2996369.1 uracil-DNA glycosylase [Cellulophaga baltica]MDO6767765.1 uracil-DNA glycosylase [Cellulophaga sp. 1_MG-2023]